MACILHIETSTDVCSVAVSSDGACIHYDETREPQAHARILAPFVRDALSFADNHAIPVDAVSVSIGPGSYTGLRIGLSTAKGVCYGRNIPLITIPTLQLLCVSSLLQERVPEGALLCPMIDARRMEVYAAVYDRALREVRPAAADIVEADTYDDFLNEHDVYFLGNGSEKCHDVLTHPHAHFIEQQVPLAKYMFPLAEKAFLRGQFADTAYCVPFYLKQFVAGKPKNLLEKP